MQVGKMATKTSSLRTLNRVGCTNRAELLIHFLAGFPFLDGTFIDGTRVLWQQKNQKNGKEVKNGKKLKKANREHVLA